MVYGNITQNSVPSKGWLWCVFIPWGQTACIFFLSSSQNENIRRGPNIIISTYPVSFFEQFCFFQTYPQYTLATGGPSLHSLVALYPFNFFIMRFWISLQNVCLGGGKVRLVNLSWLFAPARLQIHFQLVWFNPGKVAVIKFKWSFLRCVFSNYFKLGESVVFVNVFPQNVHHQITCLNCANSH